METTNVTTDVTTNVTLDVSTNVTPDVIVPCGTHFELFETN